jgi:CDGSH-type Zn-finger protein
MNCLENKELPKANDKIKIRVLKNGPYLVSGNVPLTKMTIQCDTTAIPSDWLIGEPLKTSETYTLCRCGQTKNKPFCDATHLKVNFDGTETSDNEPFEKMAKVIGGPELMLNDAEILCASARFCHRGGDIWPQISKSDDPKLKANAIRNACDCPSGRLVIIDKQNGKTIEPLLEKSVGLIEDQGMSVDGPIWVRGEIPVYSAEGKLYEVRNRVTLCRCGKSTNKPFCDSSHYPEEDQEVIEDEQK